MMSLTWPYTNAQEPLDLTEAAELIGPLMKQSTFEVGLNELAP